MRRRPSAGTDVAELAEARIDSLFRDHWWAAVAAVAASVHDLQVAEDAVQDACVAAIDQWTTDGIPKNARAWLVGVARHKAIDRLRREAMRRGKEEAAVRDLGQVSVSLDQVSMIDEQLALIFTCCHPALDPTVQIALTLRAVCGLTTSEIAAAFGLTVGSRKSATLESRSASQPRSPFRPG